MSRSERLLDLLQVLRGHRLPVSGKLLAERTGVSIRTLYRDIASLQAKGANIEGEAGVGYILKPGFMLPPMMFSAEEIEALVLGSRWVAQRTDDPLAQAARNALARIAAVLPQDLRDDLETSTLIVGPGGNHADSQANLTIIRNAIRTQCKLDIAYRDGKEVASTRTVWPFALAFFDEARVVLAWCELRQDFRSFRTDRIDGLALADMRYPRRKHALLKEWREKEGIPQNSEGLV